MPFNPLSANIFVLNVEIWDRRNNSGKILKNDIDVLGSRRASESRTECCRLHVLPTVGVTDPC